MQWVIDIEVERGDFAVFQQLVERFKNVSRVGHGVSLCPPR